MDHVFVVQNLWLTHHKVTNGLELSSVKITAIERMFPYILCNCY